VLPNADSSLGGFEVSDTDLAAHEELVVRAGLAFEV